MSVGRRDSGMRFRDFTHKQDTEAPNRLSPHFQRWSGSFACSVAWKAHDGIVLSSVIVPSRNPVASPVQPSDPGPQWVLITGASDNHIKVAIMLYIYLESIHLAS